MAIPPTIFSAFTAIPALEYSLILLLVYSASEPLPITFPYKNGSSAGLMASCSASYHTKLWVYNICDPLPPDSLRLLRASFHGQGAPSYGFRPPDQNKFSTEYINLSSSNTLKSSGHLWTRTKMRIAVRTMVESRKRDDSQKDGDEMKDWSMFITRVLR